MIFLFIYLFFFLILIWGVMWLIVRERAKFVELFKNFQCVLNYYSSSSARGNLNGLGFHLVQEYLHKLSIRFI